MIKTGLAASYISVYITAVSITNIVSRDKMTDLLFPAYGVFEFERI